MRLDLRPNTLYLSVAGSVFVERQKRWAEVVRMEPLVLGWMAYGEPIQLKLICKRTEATTPNIGEPH